MRIRGFIFVVAVTSLIACGNSPPPATPPAPSAASIPEPPAPVASSAATPHASAAPTTTPSAPPPAPVPDITASCAEEIKRSVTCKDDFVPMIVDTRIKLDLPKGVAAKGKDKAGRAKLVTLAKKEFADDYAADKIKGICEKRQAQVASVPPEVVKEMLAMQDKCKAVADKDCKGFAACMAPILEKMLGMGASSGTH